MSSIVSTHPTGDLNEGRDSAKTTDFERADDVDFRNESFAGGPDLRARNVGGVKSYIATGQPWIWLTAAAISIAFLITVGLLSLTAARGLPHFWPARLMEATYAVPGEAPKTFLAERVESERVPTPRLLDAGIKVDPKQTSYERSLLKTANRDVAAPDFSYCLDTFLTKVSYPADALTLERLEYGDFHGFATGIREGDKVVATTGPALWEQFDRRVERVGKLRQKLKKLEKSEIGRINNALEDVRLDTRRLELKGKTPATDAADFAALDARKKKLDGEYEGLRGQLDAVRKDMGRDVLLARPATGDPVEIPFEKIVRGYRPNALALPAQIRLYGAKLWEFVSDDPREANTEGGIFPAIFGTVMMVILMSVVVTPFGILAALYLREYATQGRITQLIRIAVNNLAGVPSIVYGMFGLGFFVYFVGGNIDRLFFPEKLPSPTFGTPGILWSSLTLALLTLPVVIVATEEGLARIPRSLREASLALGATKAETLWKVVLPMATPAMMTGLILAIARAAGEVAPLMLVGVVKLAPSLPLDGQYPFLHLDRKFMHLGFHIYDVGFQSPNVDAARPLVYATAFLLVLVIVLLNVSAIRIRNRLRERYKALEH